MAACRNWLEGFFLALAVLMLVGCGGGSGTKNTDKESGKVQDKDKGGQQSKMDYETPQAVFDAAKTAVKEKDYQKLAGLMTEESRDVFAGSMVALGALFKTMGAMIPPDNPARKKFDEASKELTSAFQKHNVAQDELQKAMEKAQELAKQKDPSPQIVKKALIAMAAPVEDRNVFLGEVLKIINKVSEGKGEMPFSAESKLEGLEVNGDSAKAKLDQGIEKKESIEFTKTVQGWRIVIPDEAYAELLQHFGGPELPPPPGKNE